jgi:hypothetical protein
MITGGRPRASKQRIGSFDIAAPVISHTVRRVVRR